MLRIFAFIFLFSTFYVRAELTISHGTVRLLPPGVPNTSAYFTIENNGDEDRYLVSAYSKIAKTVELHNHVINGESMRMEKQQSVKIPAGESVQFSPGGLHLMIFSLLEPLKEGQKVTLSLTTKQGSTISFDATVVMPGQEAHHSHHH